MERRTTTFLTGGTAYRCFSKEPAGTIIIDRAGTFYPVFIVEKTKLSGRNALVQCLQIIMVSSAGCCHENKIYLFFSLFICSHWRTWHVYYFGVEN